MAVGIALAGCVAWGLSPNATWLNVVGAACAAIAALLASWWNAPAVVRFTTADWVKVADGWDLLIPRSEHGRKEPHATIWELNADGGSDLVETGVSDTSDGALRLHIDGPGPIDGSVRFV